MNLFIQIQETGDASKYSELTCDLCDPRKIAEVVECFTIFIFIEADGIEQKVIVSRIPEKLPPNSTMFDYTDQNVEPGVHAYYVRILQSDGEKAWSSPIFINYEKKD